MKTILIIDDDADDRDLFREALHQVASHVQCLEADDGDVALVMLNQPDAPLPDIIFLDLNMPRMNGRQCLIEIKKSATLSRIPIIIYTTSKRSADREETRNLGAIHFITKPAAFDIICQSIDQALAHQWTKEVPAV